MRGAERGSTGPASVSLIVAVDGSEICSRFLVILLGLKTLTFLFGENAPLLFKESVSDLLDPLLEVSTSLADMKRLSRAESSASPFRDFCGEPAKSSSAVTLFPISLWSFRKP